MPPLLQRFKISIGAWTLSPQPGVFHGCYYLYSHKQRLTQPCDRDNHATTGCYMVPCSPKNLTHHFSSPTSWYSYVLLSATQIIHVSKNLNVPKSIIKITHVLMYCMQVVHKYTEMVPAFIPPKSIWLVILAHTKKIVIVTYSMMTIILVGYSLIIH